MKKIKLLTTALLSASIITIMAGCKSKNENKQITVTDMLGDSITINKNPKKVACVSRTTYDLLVAFGLGDKIDGAYKTIYDNQWTSTIYSNSTSEYRYEYNESYETFITRGVDLVFSPEKYISDDLKEHGIKSLCVSLYGNPTFDNYVYYFADLVTQIWDSNDVKTKVEKWKSKVSKAINDIKQELNKHELSQKKIMYVRGDKNKGIEYTDTKGSFTEYAYRILGFDFAGSSFDTNKPSKEEICSYNPDAFVIGGVYQNKLVEALKNDAVYSNLNAVKNGNIYTIPVGLTMFEQLSAVTPLFFYDMANKIYPEYFNYDISTMLKETIKEYFNTDLTNEDINNILTGKNKDGNDLA